MLETYAPASYRIPPPAARSTPEQQRWRNAVARRKLEAMRDLEHLRLQLQDVWDETAGN